MCAVRHSLNPSHGVEHICSMIECISGCYVSGKGSKVSVGLDVCTMVEFIAEAFVVSPTNTFVDVELLCKSYASST